MDFQHFAPQIASLPRRTPKEIGSIVSHNVLRDNFTITTWLALGALLQGGLLLFARPSLALMPTVLVLAYRFTHTVLMHLGIVRNTLMDDVLVGKYSIQVPDKDGNPPSQPSESTLAVIMLGLRSNHPLGVFAPGSRDISNSFRNMLVELAKDKKNSGFLGFNTYMATNERQTNNQFMTCCYFRSNEDIHRFAHGPTHREAWNWWNNMVADNPHLSIMHEVYEAPKSHWENIFVNYNLTGIGKIQTPVMIGGQEFEPIANADRGPLSTQNGRLGKMQDSPVNEKQHLDLQAAY